MKVLITGGAGFIGSHLCDELLAHGYEVRVLDSLEYQVHGDRRNHPPEYLDKRVEFIYGATFSPYALEYTCIKSVDAVIHLAASVGVGQSTYKPLKYVLSNTQGTAALLERLIEHPPKKLIVASSMSIYGEGRRLGADNFFGHYADHPSREGFDAAKPIATPEDKQPDLQSIYALTKYDQERLCLLFGRAYHVPTIALRLFNVYGPRQSLNNPYTGAMAIFASRLLNNHPPIIFEDGQQRRDFVSVHDVARAFRLALESDVADEVINIGSGRDYTILQLAEKLTTALGKDILPEITHQHRVGDIRHCFADVSKARELLNYQPSVSLDEGIAELVEWLKTQQAVDKFDECQTELVEKGLLR